MKKRKKKGGEGEPVVAGYAEAIKNLRQVKEVEIGTKINDLDQRIKKRKEDQKTSQKKRSFIPRGLSSFSNASESIESLGSVSSNPDFSERKKYVDLLTRLRNDRTLEKIINRKMGYINDSKVLGAKKLTWTKSTEYLDIVLKLNNFSFQKYIAGEGRQKMKVFVPIVYGSFTEEQANEKITRVIGNEKSMKGISLVEFMLGREEVEGESKPHFLPQKLDWSIWKKMDILLKALEGIKMLHDAKIMHSNINENSFLVVLAGLEQNSENEVVFGPWGTWKSIEKSGRKRRVNYSNVKYKDPTAWGERDRYKPNFSSDLFSFGCVLYRLIYEREPDTDFSWVKDDLEKLLLLQDESGVNYSLDKEFSDLMNTLKFVMRDGDHEDDVKEICFTGCKRSFEEMYNDSKSKLRYPGASPDGEVSSHEAVVRLYETICEVMKSDSYLPLLSSPETEESAILTPSTRRLAELLSDFLVGKPDNRRIDDICEKMKVILPKENNWNLKKEAERVRSGKMIYSPKRGLKKYFFTESWMKWDENMMKDWMRCNSFSDGKLFSEYEQHVGELMKYLQRKREGRVFLDPAKFGRHKKQLEYHINFIRNEGKDWRFNYDGLLTVHKKAMTQQKKGKLTITSLYELLRMTFPCYMMDFYLDPKRSVKFNEAMKKLEEECRRKKLPVDKEEIEEKVKQMTLGTSVENIEISVKVVITESGADGYFENAMEKIGGFITKLVPPLMPKFGLFHAGVVIGDWKLDWNRGSLAWPGVLMSDNAYISYDVGLNVEPEKVKEQDDGKKKKKEKKKKKKKKEVRPQNWMREKKFKDLCYDLAKLICDWNQNKWYDLGSLNCQDFVCAVLETIGFVHNKEALVRLRKRFLQEAVTSERVSWNREDGGKETRSIVVYKMEEEFAKKFGQGGKLVRKFLTHQDFDQFLEKIVKHQDGREVTERGGKYYIEGLLLKSIDRAFWLRHYELKSRDRERANDPSKNPFHFWGNANNCRCHFRDPKKSNSYTCFHEGRDLKNLKELRKKVIGKEELRVRNVAVSGFGDGEEEEEEIIVRDGNENVEENQNQEAQFVEREDEGEDDALNQEIMNGHIQKKKKKNQNLNQNKE